MVKILIFAGTLEGRKLAEFLARQGVSVYVSVATRYGESLLPEDRHITPLSGRMDLTQMETFLNQEHIGLVVDATHPYAQEVTKNIRQACEDTGTEYLRLQRGTKQDASLLCLESVEAAAEYLCHTSGNVLLTTGSKELGKYTVIPNYRDRLYARVLSLADVAVSCKELGFEGKNLICMQGPFSEELDYAMLKQIDAKYLVTKETGKAGGFAEKCSAAARLGVQVIVVGKPPQGEGFSYEETINQLIERYSIPVRQKITIAGIGMGTRDTMTQEAAEAFAQADLVIGAKRMLENLGVSGKPVFISYHTEEICQYIASHPQYERIAVAMSGDVGFYSGTKKLLDALKEYDVQVLPGISSVVYFCAKLHKSWEDTKLVSAHGKTANIVDAVKNHARTFALLGSSAGVGNLCRDLLRYGLSHTRLWIGENLSYENERITAGTPEELKDKTFDPLCVVLAENDNICPFPVTHGLPDSLFIRGNVPMTKEEVRSISLSKLRLKRDSVIYDVGAGTGSVSIEMALQAPEGAVYAVERNDAAIDLIQQNKEKMGTANLFPIPGAAPEALADLPTPTHAFIGGSAGNMREILQLLLEKNPRIRLVINAIALETISETLDCMKTLALEDVDIVSVSVSRSKTLGRYHMMMGENPIYIFSCNGSGAENEKDSGAVRKNDIKSDIQRDVPSREEK